MSSSVAKLSRSEPKIKSGFIRNTQMCVPVHRNAKPGRRNPPRCLDGDVLIKSANDRKGEAVGFVFCISEDSECGQVGLLPWIGLVRKVL